MRSLHAHQLNSSFVRPQSAKVASTNIGSSLGGSRHQIYPVIPNPMARYEGEESQWDTSNRVVKVVHAGGSRSGSANRQIVKKPLYNSFAEYNKHVPKQIFQDKEKLHYETLQLKTKIHSVSTENTKLKTRLTALEKEALKMEKLIEEIEQNGTYKNHFAKSTNDSAHLIANLKKSLKDSKAELDLKLDELQKLKKGIKYTRIQELESEKKAFSDETMRLKHLLDQSLNQRIQMNIDNEEIRIVEEKYSEQNGVIVHLRRENSELAQAIKQLEDQNYHLQNTYVDIEKRNQREAMSLKKILKEKEKDLQQQREELERSASNQNAQSRVQSKNIQTRKDENAQDISSSNKTSQLISIGQKQRKISSENKSLKDQVAQKHKSIAELEKKIIETQQQYREMIEVEKRENQQLKSELDKELLLNHKLRQRLRVTDQKDLTNTSPLVDAPLEMSSPNKKMMNRTVIRTNKNPATAVGSIDDFSASPEKVEDKKLRKRVETVQLESIREAGEELNLKLKANGFEWDELVLAVFPNISEDSDIPTLTKILIAQPFNVKSEKMAEQIARYCIENNAQSNWVFLDLSKSCSNQIIKSILRQIIGPYRLMDAQEAQTLYQSIIEFMQPKRQALMGFTKDKAGKRNFLRRDEIVDVFTLCDLELPKEYLDFILTAIITSSASVAELNYTAIFTTFDPEKPVPDLCVRNPENLRKLTNEIQQTTRRKSGIAPKNNGGFSDEENLDDDEEDDFKDLTEQERALMVAQQKQAKAAFASNQSSKHSHQDPLLESKVLQDDNHHYDDEDDFGQSNQIDAGDVSDADAEV